MLIQDLDRILDFISNEENKGNNFQSYDIKKHLFSNLNEDQVENMIREIIESKPKVITTLQSEPRVIVECNGLTRPFLKKGGFQAIFDNDFAKEVRKNEIEDLEFEKSSLDLILKKWQKKVFWPVFLIALLGGGYSAFDFIERLIIIETPKQ